MDYTELINDIVQEDEKIESLLDKALEKYLDTYDTDINKLFVKAYKSVSEFDDGMTLMKFEGYEAKQVDYYKNNSLALVIFEKQ